LSVRIPLPPGNAGLRMEDGTHYRADREGGTVTVSDEHAPHVRREVGGDAGLTGHGSFRVFGGTREGRWCPSCRKLWNHWNAACVKCGEPTIPEAEMPAAPPSRMPSACLVPLAPVG
jgi:hypothetical protein